MLKYLSLFSGIEAATCAWGNFPMLPVAFSEIEPFCCNVLAKHYPQVPNLGDITKFTPEMLDKLGHIDLVVGGSPCQGLSVAGRRLGFDDERSKLALNYIAVIRRLRPRWFIWENVPGVLSTRKGADFRVFVSLLAECGYSLAWRVLDAQYFGVPQRRRRLYVVGSADPSSDGPGKILLDDTGMSRTPPQDLRQRLASTERHIPDYSETVFDMSHACDVLRTYYYSTPTLTARMGTGGNNIPLVVQNGRLRKLTPTECLRLQGFPDYWFDDIKGYSNTAAYKAIGNSMAVPVMHWLGRRLCEYTGQEGFQHCD